MEKISILFPNKEGIIYKQVSEVTCHDLGLETICQKVSKKENEQRMIMNVLAKTTDDPYVAEFRSEVFEDIVKYPQMRDRMMELLDKVSFLKDYGSFKRDYDKKAGIWDLLHRMSEINDYINCVEAISECLADKNINSEGLKNLKKYVDDIYKDAHFGEMKSDIEALKADTSNLKSITVGINLNERFETESIGLISVNNKEFKKSGIVNNFADALAGKNTIREGNEWNGEMNFHPVDQSMLDSTALDRFAAFEMMQNPAYAVAGAATIVKTPEADAGAGVSHYMDKIVSQLLGNMVKKLRDVLSKYVMITINTITDLIPEFIYYIRFAEYLEPLMNKGYKFCAARAVSEGKLMEARGLYNLMLLAAHDDGNLKIVDNDLDFDKEHLVYLLTGANRGGKTTITQAVGLMFILAQGGIFVPAEEFIYQPVDCIYTHYPADEDKTMDLGRLGEECSRFKDIYTKSTDKSLLLLNETFSTTSFEEGYYIARDSVRAILNKGVRTIYNTHMHKLARDIEEINAEFDSVKAASLVVKSNGKERSFKVEVMPCEGQSYADDIARKYGVTYEDLICYHADNEEKA